MKILKDDKERRLDELTSLADETMAFYRDLLPQIGETELHTALVDQITEQDTLLGDLGRAMRRSSDELPQAGDPERARLRALFTGLKSALTPGDSHDGIVAALIEANDTLRQVAADAASCPLTAEEQLLVTAFARSCENFARSLAARGG